MLKNNTFLVLVLILFSFNIHSQNITEKGIATVELAKNSCRDGKPTDRNKNLEALRKAKISAWSNFISSLPGDRASIYYSRESEFLTNIDEYISDYVILTNNCSKKERSFSITIRATINESKFTNTLVSNSPGSSKADLSGQGIVVLVVPRKTSEALSFDDKVTKQSLSQSNLSANEVMLMDENSVSISESSSLRQSVTTGGSTSVKATKRSYIIGDLNDASTQINSILNPLGMRTFTAARLENLAKRSGYNDFLKEVLDQYSGKIGEYGANISPQKQDDIVNMIIDVGQGRLNYFLLGTVDTSLPRIDPDTGAYKSDVLVNIQLFKIDDFFGAEPVASVGPEIMTAFGETDVLSEKAALKKAFFEATNSLILKL